jgi:hypothetical protein
LLFGCDAPHDCGALLEGPLPAPELSAGRLYAPNQAQIKRLLAERAAAIAEPEYVLGLVPGTSEEWGHHRAPPPDVEASGQRISQEFADRLDRAYRFLSAGVVRFLLISGGAVDPGRPDYIEAERGRAYLLQKYAPVFAGEGPLEERLLVDPFAGTTPENVRNADVLCAELGLPRSLILTTMPRRATLSPSDFSTQGYYLLEHEISSFDSRCRSDLGYTLGAFEHRFFELGASREAAIHHCQLSVNELRGDAFWP